MLLRQSAPKAGLEDLGVSPLEMADYRTRSHALAGPPSSRSRPAS